MKTRQTMHLRFLKLSVPNGSAKKKRKEKKKALKRNVW